MAANPPTAEPSIAPRLGLWDTVSIIVGIVVGTAIFKSPPATCRRPFGAAERCLNARRTQSLNATITHSR